MSTWALDNVFLSDSEDESDELKRDWKLGREALLFVVDANLFTDDERYNEALDIVRNAIISGLLVNDKDLVGIVFANTARSKEPLEAEGLANVSMPEHCSVFVPLRQMNKGIVEHFLQFCTMAGKRFMEDYGIAPQNGCSSFAQMMRLCLSLFDNCGIQVNNASMVFLTDRETPHPKQSSEWQMALLKAKDLEGKSVDFQVIPMVDEFNYNEFYAEFISLSKDQDLEKFVAPNAQLQREILKDRKLRQDFLCRSLGRINLSIGPNVDVSVQYYNYFKRRTYPRKVTLMRKDNSIVQKKFVLMLSKEDSETNEVVEEREVKLDARWYELNLGGMPVRITPAHMIRIRNLHPPGMMLLGFKPKIELSKVLYYKPCNFMYPDERNIAGSKTLFRGLWQRCLERDKIAICIFMRKRNSIPRYVALVPVKAINNENSDEDNNDNEKYRTLLSGDGFKIVYLPVAKHIRKNDISCWNTADNEATDEGVELFKKMISKLRVKYQPEFINDPTLELLQSKILSLSLNIKTENDGVTALPDGHRQDQRLAKLLPKLEEIFGTEVEAAKKRPAKSDDSENAPKKIKISEDDVQNLTFVQNLIAQNNLNVCTVAQLRLILQMHFDKTAPKSVVKNALIESIINASITNVSSD